MRAACFDANRRLTRGEGWLDAEHESPDPRCQCGIYGYWTPGPRSWFGEAYWCEGVITAWGRVEVHRDGFRAEHARVEALAVPDRAYPGTRPAVAAAAASLDVPLVDYEALRDFAGSLGGVGIA